MNRTAFPAAYTILNNNKNKFNYGFIKLHGATVKIRPINYIVHVVHLVELNSKKLFFIFLEPSKLVLVDKNCFLGLYVQIS